MKTDYTQPFFVGHNNPRFPNAVNGYLPALETRDTREITQSTETQWERDQWDTVKQLRAMVSFLQTKLNKHLDAPKTKARRKFTIK